MHISYLVYLWLIGIEKTPSLLYLHVLNLERKYGNSLEIVQMFHFDVSVIHLASAKNPCQCLAAEDETDFDILHLCISLKATFLHCVLFDRFLLPLSFLPVHYSGAAD